MSAGRVAITSVAALASSSLEPNPQSKGNGLMLHRKLHGFRRRLDPRSTQPFVLFPAHRALLIRVPKVASISVIRWFERLGDSPKEVFVRPLPLAYSRRYTNFAIVRNPWERLASAWVDKVERGGKSLGGLGDGSPSFEHFVRRLEGCSLATSDPHVRPQSLLVPERGLDLEGRFEDLPGFVAQLSELLGIVDPPEIPHFNATGVSERLGELYSTELVEAVARLYSEDIDRFGYSFPPK